MKKTDIGVVNRFSWHEFHGDLAENYLKKYYFKNLDLKFRKIRKDKNGQKPDGYILSKKNKKIAIAEMKLIKYKPRQSNLVERITIDETITRSIKKAKKQLKTTVERLPKIIYLILDDSFAKFETVKFATFGKWITIVRAGKIIYNSYSGLCYKFWENNKLRDNLISAIICYKKTLDSYKIYIIRDIDAITLPRNLLDKKHLVELWDYNSQKLKKIKPRGIHPSLSAAKN